MPAPSALPLINAAALAIAIVAITISWWLVGVAMVVFLGTTIRWIRDVQARHRRAPARASSLTVARTAHALEIGFRA